MEGFGYPVQVAIALLIFLLNIYGPFVLLFFFPVPFLILLTGCFQKLSYRNHIYIPFPVSKTSLIRGPPTTIISR